MSEKKNTAGQLSALDALALRIQTITGSVTSTQMLISMLTDAIELDGEQQETVVQECDTPDRKLAYLAGRQSAYRDLRRGALRALELVSGQPPQDGQEEPIGGDAV